MYCLKITRKPSDPRSVKSRSLKSLTLNKAFHSAAFAAVILFPGCEAELKTTGTTVATATANVCSESFPEFMDSMAFRSDNATFDPMNPGTRTRATLLEEILGSTAFTSNHALVPNPHVDTDGRYSDTGVGAKRAYLETVKGRPDKICGISGTTDARVEDCATENGVKAVWEGSKYGSGGESDWKLVALRSTSYCDDPGRADANDCIATYGSGNGAWVNGTCAVFQDTNNTGLYLTTQTACVTGAGLHWNASPQASNASSGGTCQGGIAGGCIEVWRDERTKLVWSSPMLGAYVDQTYSGYNWFQAAGYSKNATTQSDTDYEGAGPTVAGGGSTYSATNCSNPATKTCQPDLAISVCADAGVVAGLNGVATYQNPDATNGTVDESLSKGGMTGPSHQWRLPTIEDFKLADVNGMRKVLAGMDNCFWSASSDSSSRGYAWSFCGGGGYMNGYGRYGSYPVVCVGR
jgi:hypothetical protein